MVSEGHKTLLFSDYFDISRSFRGQGSKSLGQDLQCHVPVQLGIGGPVEFAHTTFAYFLQNFVMGDGLADQKVPLQDGVTRLCVDSRPSGGSKAMGFHSRARPAH